jgi:integrase
LSLTRAQVWDGADVTREVTVERRDLKGGRGARRRSIRSRRMPLSEPVRAAIREHLASIDPEGTFLFETSRSAGKGMNRSQAYRVLVKACVACGIDPARISTHSLRKTFVTRIYEASGHDLIRTHRAA